MNVSDFMTPDPITVSPGQTSEEALLLMDHHGIRHLPVVDEDGLVGVVSDRDLLGSTGWRIDSTGPSRMRVADVMAGDPVTVNPDDRVIAATVEVSSRGIGCLPVVEDRQLVGIVSEMDLIRLVASTREEGEGFGPVSSIAAHGVVTATPDADFGLLDELMAAKGVRHVPIVEDDRLVGIVSDRDMRRSLGAGDGPAVRARDLMSDGVLTISDDADVRDVAMVMADRRISALVTTAGDGQVLGIVTSTDLVEFALGALDGVA